MKRIKFLKEIFIFIALLSCVCLLLSCKDDQSETELKTISFRNEGTIFLDLNGSATLIPILQGFDDDVTINWVSSNPSVVSVNNQGVITAESEGEVTVTASIEDVSASIKVIVVSENKVPDLVLNQFDDNILEISYGETFTLNPIIKYNNEIVTGSTFTYTVNDSTVISINDEGVITTVGIGETQVTVQGAWKSFTGTTLLKTFKVIVKEDAYIEINQQEYTIYTSDIFGDETSCELDFDIYDSGTKLNNPYSNVDYFYDSDYISVDGSTVSVACSEDVKAFLQISYTSTLGTVITETVTIDIKLPVQDRTTDIVLPDYQLVDEAWTIDSSDIFEDGSQITKITDDNNPSVNLYDGGALALTNDFSGERLWTVYSDKGYGYIVKVSVVTEVITTSARFKELFLDANRQGQGPAPLNEDLGGYYVLGNNIEFSALSGGYTADIYPNKYRGFKGIFDGRGYTVANFSISGGDWNNPGSIFGDLTAEGVIRNVGFTNLSILGPLAGIAKTVYGTIDNVFVGICLWSTYWGINGTVGFTAGAICRTLKPGATVSNCVTYLNGRPDQHPTHGNWKNMASFINIYEGGTLINNYTATNIDMTWGTSRYSPAIFFNHSGRQITENELKVFYSGTFSDDWYFSGGDYSDGEYTGLSADIWDLTPGCLPVMKSALNLAKDDLYYVDGPTITAGASKEFAMRTYGLFSYYNLELEDSSKGTIIRRPGPPSWTSARFILTAESGLSSGDTITVYLKYFDRIVDTLVYTVD